MAKFKYLGPDNVLVGRFGRLQRGQVVDLWQSEAEYILKNKYPDWQCVDEEDLAGVGIVVPARTPFFDLTRIYWLKEAYESLNRLGRAEMLSVCLAMRSLGAKIPTEKELSGHSREALRELAYSEVKRLRWDQPGYEPRHDLDVSTPAQQAAARLKSAQTGKAVPANNPVKMQELASTKEETEPEEESESNEESDSTPDEGEDGEVPDKSEEGEPADTSSEDSGAESEAKEESEAPKDRSYRTIRREAKKTSKKSKS